MFLIAGIQPRVKKLEAAALRCPVCGRYEAYRQRVDHYLSLFFIPLLKVKTGQPFTLCNHCAHAGSEAGTDQPPGPSVRPSRCTSCGHPLKREFSFCPYCGTAR